jgi:hypothetical protein
MGILLSVVVWMCPSFLRGAVQYSRVAREVKKRAALA